MNEIDMGRKAELILQQMDEINLVEEVKTEIINMWMDTASADNEGREDLYRELHGLKALMARLRSKVDAAVIKQQE